MSIEETKYFCKVCGKEIGETNYFYDGIYGNIFCLTYCRTKYFEDRYNFTSIDFRKEASNLICPSIQRKKEEPKYTKFNRFEIMDI